MKAGTVEARRELDARARRFVLELLARELAADRAWLTARRPREISAERITVVLRDLVRDGLVTRWRDGQRTLYRTKGTR